jgi:carboxyl-terminal processing protease
MRLLDLAGPPHPVLAVLLGLALKGAVVLAVAAVIAFTLRRASAAARHLVWLTAVLGLVALPLLSAALPSWDVAVPVPWTLAEQATVAPSDRGAPGCVAELPGAGPVAGLGTGPALEEPASPAPRTRTVPEPAVAGSPWPLWLWLAGAVLAALPIAGGFLSLWQLGRSCRPVTAGPAACLLQQIADGLGLRRRVRLVQSGQRTMPMTWGVCRPVVLLPDEADTWSSERLHVVLLHELGHVRRWDCLTQLLAHLARALHWFNPLAWLAVARMYAEQERACDDLVLNAGLDPAEYAEHLLAVTSGLSSRFLVAPVALAMGRRARMQRRLLSILDGGRNRQPLQLRGLALALVAGLVLVMPLSVLRLAPQPATAAERAKDDAGRALDPVKRVTDVEMKIKEVYGKSVDDKKLAEYAIKGLVRALDDPYAQYLTAEEAAVLKGQLRGNVTGIGAHIRLTDGKVAVVTPLEDSPALKAGLRPGDLIVAIDGKTTEGLTLSDAVSRIVGREGTAVKLKVRHAEGGEEELAITRRPVKVRTVEGFRRDAGHWDYLLDSEHKIGYVRILQFGQTTGDETRSAVKGLLGKGMKGLILDLRFCPGGLLKSAYEVANLFLAQGTIVTVKGLDGQDATYKADGKQTLGDFPILVLVNEHTASAGEIVSGALKDNGRAVVLGTRTYGKGSVQQLYTLDDGGSLKLTNAHFYLPSGRNIQKRPGEKIWGVDPDDGYYVPLDERQGEALQKSQQERGLLGGKPAEAPKVTPAVVRERYADPQLAAGLETLTAKLTDGAFVKVGKSDAALQAHLAKREEVRKRRDALLKDLDRLNKELADLEKTIGEEKKP